MIGILVILLGRGSLAWILISAGLEKAWQPAQLATLLTSRLPFTARVARRIVWLVILSEFLIGIGLFLPIDSPVPAIAACGLLASFAVVLAVWAKVGLSDACGCGGLLPTQRVSWPHVISVASLALLAGCIAVVGASFWPALAPREVSLPEQLFTLFIPLQLLIGTAIGRSLRLVHQDISRLDRYYCEAK
ncbi:MAG TPA: MauE/DoxX family redox-associated membrane protein [Dehalococcoidia bacterium]|nr:MauE/DoxX family redox-associated membrane protein [Dehalococcoidia bacterium]